MSPVLSYISFSPLSALSYTSILAMPSPATEILHMLVFLFGILSLPPFTQTTPPQSQFSVHSSGDPLSPSDSIIIPYRKLSLHHVFSFHISLCGPVSNFTVGLSVPWVKDHVCFSSGMLSFVEQELSKYFVNNK